MWPSMSIGLQQRAVNALSEQVADLQAGQGMGLARAAELNGYPGPVHVPELSDRLEPSDEQLSGSANPMTP